MPRMSCGSLVSIFISLIILMHGCASQRPQQPVANCPDIASTGQLNVLTLNLLYDAPASTRAKAWTNIAQFAITHNVHVLLLQEAVLSDVDHIQDILGTSDSARDLQRVLNERSVDPYELRVAWETGIPLVLTTANAILSRCDITRHFATFLPIESEEAFEGIDLKITRNVQVAQLSLPGYGTLRVYNTHLCAACSVDSLQRQVEAVLNVVERVEGRSAANHVALGGDFNLDLSKGAAERIVFETIARAGFRDVYAAYRKDTFGDAREALCWNGKADIHCTVGVSPVLGLIDKKSGAGFSGPRRIDYLFLRGTDTIRTSRVIFNPGNAATGSINADDPAVSDHSGVFAEIMLRR
jgi:maltose 6'-phosphate phosphatase